MDESLRWGVIGAARIAREQVVPAIRRTASGDVVAVSSASGRAKPFADELGIAKTYDDHDRLLADPDVQAVYIAVPNAQHAHWIVRAAEAGKHVLCEKPLVLGTSELNRVEAAVSAAGVRLSEAFMYRHHPQHARLRQLLAEGAVGDLVAVHARLHFPLERTSQPDIRLRKDMGGGSLLDLGCYPVDLFGSLTGVEPEDASAVARRDDDGGVDTRFAGLLRYGEVLATFDCSFDSPFLNTATLVGTRGSVQLTDVFRPDLAEGVGTLVVDQDGRRSVLEVPGDQYGEQVSAFAASVSGSRLEDSRDDFALTRRTTRTLERLAQAVEAGPSTPRTQKEQGL